MSQREPSFFERERDRLATEITAGFEELLSSSNVLNRKLEEVLGMTKEYETIALLWQKFHELMRVQNEPPGDPRTVPGTGTHVVSNNSGRRQ
ncbi:DASH outer kinetochore protein [Pisolithus albus]|nr:DASH outer kinetochore protein [Pisolithus albus]